MIKEKTIEDILSKIDTKKSHEQLDFHSYLSELSAKPQPMLRNIFQLFYDMVHHYVPKVLNEYPESKEAINFFKYDFTDLTTKNVDQPFIIDMVFANRFMHMVDSFKQGAKQNQMYIIEGPHGCGKSLFLTNIVQKFQEYTNSPYGTMWESFWILDADLLGRKTTKDFIADIYSSIHSPYKYTKIEEEQHEQYVNIPCPSHDHPILQIPKKFRREFLEEIIQDKIFKKNLFNDKDFEWVLQDEPCTICSTLFEELIKKLGDTSQVFKMIHPRQYVFNRRISQGINIMNPGDKIIGNDFDKDKKKKIQDIIDSIFPLGHNIKYDYSPLALTNNGMYILMDNKDKNVERFIETHGILSEKLHKVGLIEEYINSLFICIMNPEDNKNIKDISSFSDRIDKNDMGYILDYNAEVLVYSNKFGEICNKFLPNVLKNFAKVIISSRLKQKSKGLEEWIPNSEKYKDYVDKNMHLLKMDIYSDHIPTWLSDEDKKHLTEKRRESILKESDVEGKEGISGRDSIKIFNEFFSNYKTLDRLVTMGDLVNFFKRKNGKLSPKMAKTIPQDFLDSLVDLYDYNVLQQVKKSLFFCNEEQASKDIQNYIFALYFDEGNTENNPYTGDKITITKDYLKTLESNILGPNVPYSENISLRENTKAEYISKALPQEIIIDNKKLHETKLFEKLYSKYKYTLKENILTSHQNKKGSLNNFIRAIKDYNTKNFEVYYPKTKNSIRGMISNLMKEYNYTKDGAQQVAIYILNKEKPSIY